MFTSGNGKVVRRKLKSGEVVFGFSVVRNQRINGRPRPQVLKYLGSVRQSEIPQASAKFWADADAAINQLVAANTIWKNDADKIKKQFEKVIARSATVAKPTATYPTSSNVEAIRAELAKRGIAL